MQDELQPIKLTLWKQVKNRRQHLSNGTRGELLSRYRPAERAERSPFASPGFGPKIRNSNEGLLRKSLWDGDTCSRWGALLTQRKAGYAALTAGGWQNPSLSAPTERRSNAWLRGGWRWPAFLPSERKGEGWEGALAPPVTVGKCGELRKKIATASDGTHARRICKPGFTGSEFLSQAYVYPLRVRGKPLAWCARGKYNEWRLQKCCHLLLWSGRKLNITF